MDRATPRHGTEPQKPLSIGFIVSLITLCARQASRVSKKLKAKQSRNHRLEDFLRSPKPRRGHGWQGNHWDSPPRSPLRAKPKELLSCISNKAMAIVTRKRTAEDGGDPKAEAAEEEEEYGVWQRAILMGYKCQPLDFSGVIYYDSNGRQLKDVPIRSPRGSPLPAYLKRGCFGSPLNPTVREDIKN